MLQAAKHKLQVEKARTSSIRKKIALTAGSAGAIAYKMHKAGQDAEKTARIEENEVSMNNDLYNVCELAKYAADMSIPLEAQPAPEAGSEGVLGMTNNTTLSPTSQGASVYASPSEQMQLAKAKQIAACEMAKQAAEDGVWSKVKGKARGAYDFTKGKAINAAQWTKAHPYKAAGGAAAALGIAGAAAYAYKNREKQAAAAFPGKAADDGLLSKVKGKARGAYDYTKGKVTGAARWAKAHPYKTGAGAAAALGIAGAAAYAYKNREKQASIYDYDPYEDYMDKLASVDYTGIYPEEAAYAMDSAEALYDDCLEKMAYAEELYADAADYLDYCDYMEKQANEFVPIAGSALGSAAGATAGAMIGGRFNAPRIGAGIGAAIGGAVGGPAASALENFVATSRQ